LHGEKLADIQECASTTYLKNLKSIFPLDVMLIFPGSSFEISYILGYLIKNNKRENKPAEVVLPNNTSITKIHAKADLSSILEFYILT
jgi:hypothetical protein